MAVTVIDPVSGVTIQTVFGTNTPAQNSTLIASLFTSNNEVNLPASTITVGEAINIPSGGALVGRGPGRTTVKLNTGVSGDVVTLASPVGTDFFLIKDLTIEGPFNPSQSKLILQNVEIKDGVQDGNLFSGKGGTSIDSDTNVYVPPGANFATRLQAANDLLRNRGGGVIALKQGALYELDAAVTLDAGSGVGVEGNAAWIDGSAVTSGSLVTLASRSPASALPVGIDGSNDNYGHYRASIGGFYMIVGAGADGIDINMSPGVGTRSVRALLSKFVLKGGRYGIRHRNYAYLCHVDRFAIHGQSDACINLEGGLDKGEQSAFTHGACFNAVTGLRVDTVPETGSARGVDVLFSDVKFDYLTGESIKHVSGYGKFHFRDCHAEFNHASAFQWINLSVAGSNRCQWLFEGCDWTHTGATQNFPSLFTIGNNHDVRVINPHFHDVLGAGVSGKTLIANVTGTGQWYCDGTHSLLNPQLPRHASNYANANWLADGGFDQSALIDAWYVNTGGFTGLARSASGGNLTAGCLQVTVSGGVSASRNIALVVPRKGRFCSVSLMAKLSAGSGTIEVKLSPAVIRGAITPGTKPTLELNGTQTQIDSKSMSTSYVECGLAGSAPRYELPEWATHMRILIDGFNLNADGATLSIDEVRVDQW